MPKDLMPNALTIQTLLAADAGEAEAQFDNVEDMFAWLNDVADDDSFWTPHNPS